MTTAAQRIGAGLEPARPARPIRAMERIHVIGAAGAGASAAAILAVHAGGVVTACDPGAPSPYTPAVEALGVVVAGGARGGARDGSRPGPERVAVTKALTAVDPDNPELVAARAAGIPLEPWQQVVADAAVGRTLVGVAGTHGKSTTSGWLVHTLVAAGADPSAFVGALLPSTVTGGPPATARHGERSGLRRRGGRICRQLRRLPAGHRHPDRCRMGPPRRLRGPARGDRCVRGLASPHARWARPSSRTSVIRARRRSSTGSATRPCGSWRTRSSTPRRSAAATSAGSASDSPPPPDLRARSSAASSPQTSGARPWSCTGWTSWPVR